jgi:hypothetical protein
MPVAKGRGIESRLADWLTLLEERPDLRQATNPEAVERAFTQLYASREKTGHLGLFNAAKFFGLDQENPAHQVLMLHILAGVVFWREPKGRPKGAAKWNTDKLFVLGVRAQVLRKQMGNLKGEDVAKKLKENFSDDYRYESIEAIRQRLPDALRMVRDIRERFKSRMDALGVSFPEYFRILVRDLGKEEMLTQEVLDNACRYVWGQSVE